MEQKSKAFEQVVSVLPQPLRAEASALTSQERARAEELRLRVGHPLTVVLPEGEFEVGKAAVEREHLEQLLELASCASLHSVIEQLRQGFLTISGGHRIGLCGTAVMEKGAIRTITHYSSAAIRLAREYRGIAKPVIPKLIEDGYLQSTLILAPPGAGKTSLLREIIRTVSEGEGLASHRVGVVDQRGELTGAAQGVAQFDMGQRTDILCGCSKAAGLMMLLRCMNPQVLAMDEVTAAEDVQALMDAGGCGTVLLATIHGNSREDLYRKKLYREMLEPELFSRLVTIGRNGSSRCYNVEVLK